jgi:hypothetical protein
MPLSAVPKSLLPIKENLSSAYFELRDRIDQIVAQTQQEGLLSVAVSGLNSIWQILERFARLSGRIGTAATQVNIAIQNNVNVSVVQIAERLIALFDKEPDLNGDWTTRPKRIAQILRELRARSLISSIRSRGYVKFWALPQPVAGDLSTLTAGRIHPCTHGADHNCGRCEVHRCGDEVAWNKAGIDPVASAGALWLKTRSSGTH